MQHVRSMHSACALYALKHNVKRLAEDHENAKFLAEGIKNISKLEIDIKNVQTNIIVFDIRKTGLSLNKAVNILKNKGILVVPFGPTQLRAVTHMDVSRKDMEETIRVFEKVFN